MPRWFFVHLMKTGGTSLVFMLRRQFAPDRIYPPKGVKGLVSIDTHRALSVMQDPDSSSELVFGHFPLACVEQAAGEWKTFTMLRHPVLRVLSALRRQGSADDGATPESVYADPQRFNLQFDNYMVKMLGMTAEEIGTDFFPSVKTDHRHLERALEALERFDVLGVVEDFEPFVDRLETTFDWSLGDRLRVNRSHQVELSDALVERVRKDNQLDLQLYDKARSMLGLHPLDEYGRALQQPVQT
ncbi:MAG: hypothetical protein AAGA91_17850 [Pseudomonadota bacterium]